MTERVTGKDLSRDHVGLTDTFAARRYFAKFEGITAHLGRVAAVMEQEGTLSRVDVKVLSAYVASIAATFRALSLKYLLTGRDTGSFFGSLAIDRVESGFPVYRELLTMANDAQQAASHLQGSHSVPDLKDAMIRQIVGDLTIPTKLQFACAQRLYYEALVKGGLFWAQNDPQAQWLRDLGPGRRHYLLHWAVYDSQVNLPTIYLMELDDSGRTGLPIDDRRWPEAQRHLMAQSVAGLKLLTIAQGFDRDFDDLHPKRLRRFHVGPMYSSAFTQQTGPMREVLEEAQAPEGEDWALAWTAETLESERVEIARNPVGSAPSSARSSRSIRLPGAASTPAPPRPSASMILPERPYQVLAEKDPPGFHDVRKFVVSDSGQVVSYR